MGYPENAEAIPHLVEELRYPCTFPPAYALIIDILKSIGDPALGDLRRVLREHPEEADWVRGVAIVLLGFDRSSTEMLAEDLVRCLDVVFRMDPDCSLEIMELLSRIGSPKADGAIPILCGNYKSALDQEAGGALSLPGVNIPERTFTEAWAEFRREVVRALGGFRQPGILPAVPTLELALADRDPHVRTIARQVLEWIERA
jgi:hypothetical protein